MPHLLDQNTLIFGAAPFPAIF